MTDKFLELLMRGIPKDKVSLNEMMKNHTTIKVGGPADYFIEASTEAQAVYALEAAAKVGTPLFVMGNGSNILPLDGGIRGAVLHIGKSMAVIEVSGDIITAQAGASLAAFAHCAACNGLAGIEYLSGIPGTVGGAVTMNAGAYGQEISSQILCAKVYMDSCVSVLECERMMFGYRSSLLQQKNGIVLSAQFKLKRDNPDDIFARMNAMSAARREKQPLQFPSAGSFFMRPANNFAGALIDQAGLKGFCLGGAQVSELHAGFLINTGNAKANDFICLMHYIQSTIYNKTHIWLSPEVHIIGQESK